jgi:hypothetical protein
MKPSPPNPKLFQKRVGGSVRRGKIASNLLAIANLTHYRGKGASVTIDDIHVGSSSQMLGGIPLEVFSSDYSPPLTMDVAREWMDISTRYTNHEKYRDVAINVVGFGTGFR